MKHFMLILWVSAATALQAQYSYSSGGAFSLGVQSLPTSELLSLTPDAPELNSTNFSFGGYGIWQIQRFMVGFKGAGIYGSTTEQNGLDYRVQGGYWSLDLGYKVINRDRFGLYPLIGIGLGGVTYSVASQQDINLTVPVSFNNATFDWSGVVLDIGLRAEHLFGLKETNGQKGGGFYGLELGYMVSPANSDWKTAGGSRIVGAPDYGLNGFYARLLIGGMGGKS